MTWSHLYRSMLKNISSTIRWSWVLASTMSARLPWSHRDTTVRRLQRIISWRRVAFVDAVYRMVMTSTCIGTGPLSPSRNLLKWKRVVVWDFNRSSYIYIYILWTGVIQHFAVSSVEKNRWSMTKEKKIALLLWLPPRQLQLLNNYFLYIPRQLNFNLVLLCM